MEQLLHQIYLLESHSMKLHMRFGDAEVTKSYGAAGGALSKQAAAMWDNSHGQFKTAAELKAKMAEADKVYDGAYLAFADAAREVHDSSVWQVPGRLTLGRGRDSIQLSQKKP